MNSFGIVDKEYTGRRVTQQGPIAANAPITLPIYISDKQQVMVHINNGTGSRLLTIDDYKYSAGAASYLYLPTINVSASETVHVVFLGAVPYDQTTMGATLDGDGKVVQPTEDSRVAVQQPFVGAVARTQHDKNTEFVSVKDFGAVGDGVTDDTVAWRAAIAYLKSKGGGVLYADGNYYFNSYEDLASISSIGWQNDPCVYINNVNNVVFNCKTATITVGPVVSGIHSATRQCHCFFGFNNCSNISGYLPTLVGSRVGIPTNNTAMNNGIFFESCINFNLPTLNFIGDFNNGSNISGGHIFDFKIGTINSSGTSLVVDITCVENLVIDTIITKSPPLIASCVFKLFYDLASYSYNVSNRTLNGDISNNITINNLISDGYDAAAYLDFARDCNININSQSGGKSVIIGNSNNVLTDNIKISGRISGLNDTPIVFISKFGTVFLNQLSISSCAGYICDTLSTTEFGQLMINNCDFGGQTNKFTNNILQKIAKNKGKINNCVGIDPLGSLVNVPLPIATGSNNIIYNIWPFKVSVIIKSTLASFTPHIKEISGVDINLLTQIVNTSITIILNPGDGVYFEDSVPNNWVWIGL